MNTVAFSADYHVNDVKLDIRRSYKRDVVMIASNALPD